MAVRLRNEAKDIGLDIRIALRGKSATQTVGSSLQVVSCSAR